jgi:predicted N-acetyltransferase YhbS
VAIDDAHERVVGFVNMLSDGVLTAFIPWLEVLPEYQGQGIGGELMHRILEGTERFYSVDLVCDETLVPYYARFGMSGASSALLRSPTALEAFPHTAPDTANAAPDQLPPMEGSNHPNRVEPLR